MWSGNSDVITDQVSRNYMYGNKVFILDEITSENCAFLIGDLTNFVLNDSNTCKELTFVINSPGGDAYTMMTIIGLINMARLRDMIVTTIVLGEAGSAASLIAVSGDIRLINSVSHHFVHFGSICTVTQKYTEIEKICTQNKEYADNLSEIYLKACEGKLTKAKLNELQSDERGYLNAQDCIKYGLADSIIEDELTNKREYDKARCKFEDEFNRILTKNEKQSKTKKDK